MNVVAVIAAVLGIWVVAAALLALAYGKAVQMAHRNRPRARAPRPTTRAVSAAFERVVSMATGQIPIIRLD